MRRIRTLTSLAVLSLLAVLGCGEGANPAGGGGGGTVQVVNPTATTGRNTPIQVSMTATGGQNLSFSVTSNPQNGSVSSVIGSGGNSATVTYTPNQDFVGTDTFGFQASDGTLSATGTATIHVVNSAPSALPSTVQRPSGGGPVTFMLEATDAEDDPLTFEVVSNPGQGTLSGLAPAPSISAGSAPEMDSAATGTIEIGGVEAVGEIQRAQVTYTPNPNADPSDAFSFRVTDGLLASEAANVQVTLNRIPVPLAVDQTGFKNDPVPVVVAASDEDGNALTFQILTGPAVGTLSALTQATQTSAQTVYTPPAEFTGQVTFTFRVSDGLETADGLATINLIDRVPVANDVNATTTPGVPVTITLSGLDPDGDLLTFTVTDPPTGGTLGPIVPQSATSATVVYTPAASTPGDDFRYVAMGGAETSAKARVSIAISNTKPAAIDQTVAVRMDLPRDIVLMGTDGDGDPLTFAVVTPPAHGVLSGLTPLGPGSARVTYTPTAGYEGADVFTFTVADAIQESNPGTVSLTISNAAPIANPQSVAVDADRTISIVLTGSDIDGDPLTFSIATPPPAGVLTGLVQISPTSARVEYSPNISGIGPNPFTFTVGDGSKTSTPATVMILVNPVPENSVFGTAAHVELFAGAFVLPATPHVSSLINLLSGSPTLTVATTGSQPTTAGGVVVVESDGDFHYRPPTGLTGVGADSFDFTTTSGRSATVTINLFGVPTWFVDNSVAGPGSGRSWDPFSALGSAESASLTSERIFVYRGTGATTGYDTGFTMKAAQILHGEAAGLSISPFGVLVPAGGRPSITNLGGVGIELASGAEVRGFDIAASVTGDAISGVGIAASTITDVDVAGGGARGLVLSGSTGAFTVTDVDLDGLPGSAFYVDGGDPTVTVALSGHDWSNSAGRLATVMNTTGGSVTLSGGTLTGTGDGVRVDANAGAVFFDLPASFTSTTARPVELTTSPGAITFTDLTLDATGFTGIHGRTLGSLTLTTVMVTGSGGLGIDIEGSGLDLTIPSTTVVNGGGGALRFVSNSGSAALAATDLTATGGPGVLLDSNTGTFTFTTMDVTSTGAAGISATGNTGAIDLGTADITSTTGPGLFALANGSLSSTAGVVSSTDGLALDVETTTMGLVFTSVTVGNTLGGGARFVTNTGTAALGKAVLSSNTVPALFASSGGTISVTDPTSTVDAFAAPAIDLTSTTLDGTFVSIGSLFSTTTGISLHDHSGTLTSLAGSMSFSTGDAVDIAGGSGTLSLDGFADNSSGHVFSVTGRTGGTVTLNMDFSDGGDGIVISGNAPATVVDVLGSGGIGSTTGIGFDAVAGGTITAPSGLFVGTTGTTAVRIDGTTIGAGGVTFGRVSADGGVNGIFLRDTGASGHFTVTGNGDPDSGGIITGSTGDGIVMDGVNGATLNFVRVEASAGDGYDLTDVTDFRTEDGTTTGNLGHGVRGTNIEIFDLVGSSVTLNGDAAGEHGVFLTELHGTSLIHSTTISGSATSNLVVSNSTAPTGVSDLLTVASATFGAPAGVSLADNVSFTATGPANLDARLDPGVFSNSITGGDDGVGASASGGAMLAVDVLSTAVTGTTGRGLTAEASGAGTSLDLVVATNTAANSWSTLGTGALHIGSTTGADVRAFFGGNTFTGIATGDGVSIDLDGDGTGAIRSVGNFIDAVAAGRGFFARTGGGTGTLDLTMENNDVTSMGAGASEGILIASGNGGGGESTRICLNLSGHDAVSAGGLGVSAFRLEHLAGTVFDLQDFGAADGTSPAAVAFWVNTTKLNPGSVSSVHTPSFSTAGAPCVIPVI